MSDNNSEPLVSVITPTYNRSGLLKRAISSVLNQTYQNLEMIIIDDCSTDDTEQLVNDVNDSRIKYEKLETNMGAPAARNYGISTAKGDYISLLDSDDGYLQNKLELQMKRFQELPQYVGVVYCGYYIVYEPDTIHGKVLPQYKGDIFKTLLKHNCMGSPTPLIRKECFDVCGLFDESLPSCQDWDMWIRISEKFEFDFVNELLAKTYTHGNQISTNIKNKIQAREILIDKYRDQTNEFPDTKAYLLQKLGFLYLLDKHRFKSRKYYLKSILANPMDFENYMILLTSLLSKTNHMNRMKGSSIREENNIIVYF